MTRARPLLLLCAVSIVYRLPYLLNPASFNSDGAMVGLQARHILKDWSWFIWGNNYQASFDPLMHALAFAVFGSTPLVMVCGTLAAALLMITLAFLALRRHLEELPALLCCLPLVFAPTCWNHFVEMGFRQWPLTAFIAAVWMFDHPGRRAWAFAGGVLSLFMLWLDLFMLQIVPALFVFALLCMFRDRVRLALAAGGALMGGVFLWFVRHGLPGDAPTKLELSRLAHNWDLLVHTCGPWLTGGLAYWTTPRGEFAPWPAPWPVRIVQIVGPLLLIAAVIFGGAGALLKRFDAGVRRLGLLGFLAAGGAVGGFLFSTWPTDFASARYLAPGAVAIPFALAPAAALLGARRFAAGFAPALVAMVLSSWLGYSDMIRGPFPHRTPRGKATDERELRDELRALGVQGAAADYWLAYRLSFLFEEQPTVANIGGWERMPAYRYAFERAQVRALIFHPSVPNSRPEVMERELRGKGVRFERREIGEFTVLLYPR